MMTSGYKILIADRNPHIRSLLKREMEAEGYEVYLTKSFREIARWADSGNPLDLLILDPDLPDSQALNVLDRIRERMLNVPVIVHTLTPGTEVHLDVSEHTLWVKKGGNSADRLKRATSQILAVTHLPR